MGVKLILNDLQVPFSSPIKVLWDNESAIFSALDFIQHGIMKHVDIDGHFIKEKVNSSKICNLYIQTEDQRADILTKGLGISQFQNLCSKLGMKKLF